MDIHLKARSLFMTGSKQMANKELKATQQTARLSSVVMSGKNILPCQQLVGPLIDSCDKPTNDRL
jgi:hypothetical protein